MKRLFFCLLGALPLGAWGVPVHQVTAETSHMSADTLTKRFSLKSGDLFTEQAYAKAKRDLQDSHIFRTLEFVEKEHKDGMDIHIKADDRTYVLPLFFGLSGNKHTVGGSVLVENLFKKGESVSLFVGGGRDGFDTHGDVKWGKHKISAGYSHINFEQYFYEGGWSSAKNIFSAADDKGKHSGVLLGKIKGRQDDLFLSYQYWFSSVWNFSLTPQYEYYRYKNDALDGGNHSYVTVGLQYADQVRTGLSMEKLLRKELLKKEDMLRDLPRVRTGKLAEISYSAGGHWTGSEYDIEKLAVGGMYLWELKARHIIAVFAKGQRALKAPFSNQIQSSDLLFGMGIYDREQRGKGGVSAGISFTYFLLRNKTGILDLTPFYEQAYITSGGRSYEPHSGIGASLGYRLWRIALPINLTFTHNLNDGSHHVGCKVGGHF